jgi:hypothetical protein
MTLKPKVSTRGGKISEMRGIDGPEAMYLKVHKAQAEAEDVDVVAAGVGEEEEEVEQGGPSQATTPNGLLVSKMKSHLDILNKNETPLKASKRDDMRPRNRCPCVNSAAAYLGYPCLKLAAYLSCPS